MPLYVYPNIYASGSVPVGWIPTKDGTIKYPVRNAAVRQASSRVVARQMAEGYQEREDRRSPLF